MIFPSFFVTDGSCEAKVEVDDNSNKMQWGAWTWNPAGRIERRHILRGQGAREMAQMVRALDM